MNLNERLDKHLQDIREDAINKQELNKILAYAKNLFKNNDSKGYGDQVPKALKLLELVATEDLKAKAESRKFNPENVKIDIKKIAPDPITYVKDSGYWDGGDDEDYAHCCLNFDGDGDLIQVAKEFLSKEARKFIKDVTEEALDIYFDKVDKAYKEGTFDKIRNSLWSKYKRDVRFKKEQAEYYKSLKNQEG